MNKFKLTVTFLACGVEHTNVIKTDDWTKIRDELKFYSEHFHDHTQNIHWPWIKELKITCEE
jgi:hypothetical protein